MQHSSQEKNTTNEVPPTNSQSVVIAGLQETYHIFKGESLTRLCALYLFWNLTMERK